MYPTQTHIRVISGLFLISLFIRLLALWMFPEPHLSSNARIAYLGGAHRLVEGDGFRDPSYPVFTPPLYAIFIAVSLYLFGDDQIPVKIAQAFADSLTVVIVYLITKHIFGRKTAFLSSAVLSIYPFSIYPVTYIGTETFFTLFLSLFVLLSLYAIRYERWQYYVCAGIVLGLATLTRATTQFYPLFFLITLLSLKKPSKPTLIKYLTFAMSFTLVMLPWSLRNYVVLNDLIPVATGGINFLGGSSEKFFTISENRKAYPEFFELLKSRGIEKPSEDSKPSERDRFLIRAGVENYKMRWEQEPISIVPFMVYKFIRLWYATESGAKGKHVTIISINILIYLLCLGGIILAMLRKNNLSSLLLGVLIYFILLHWITLPLFRYMVPVMPYVIGFGSFAVTAGMERLWVREVMCS